MLDTSVNQETLSIYADFPCTPPPPSTVYCYYAASFHCVFSGLFSPSQLSPSQLSPFIMTSSTPLPLHKFALQASWSITTLILDSIKTEEEERLALLISSLLDNSCLLCNHSCGKKIKQKPKTTISHNETTKTKSKSTILICTIQEWRIECNDGREEKKHLNKYKCHYPCLFVCLFV